MKSLERHIALLKQDSWEIHKKLQEKNDEIERLNNDIKVLLKENENKEKVIKAQDNIIKEVREYIEYQLENLDFEEDTKAKMLCAMVLVLLDKEKE